MHADNQRWEISRNCAYGHKQLFRPNSQFPTAAPVPWAHLCSSSFLLLVYAKLVLLWAKYIQKLQKQLSINNNINKTNKLQEINKLRFHRHATTIKTNASCESVLPWGGTRPLGARRERGTCSLDPWLTPPCHQAHSSYFCSVSGRNAPLLLHCFASYLYLPSGVLEQERPIMSRSSLIQRTFSQNSPKPSCCGSAHLLCGTTPLLVYVWARCVVSDSVFSDKAQDMKSVHWG